VPFFSFTFVSALTFSRSLSHSISALSEATFIVNKHRKFYIVNKDRLFYNSSFLEIWIKWLLHIYENTLLKVSVGWNVEIWLCHFSRLRYPPEIENNFLSLNKKFLIELVALIMNIIFLLKFGRILERILRLY
jgi:hypothetical protein